MSWARVVAARLRGLFARQRMDRELDDEVLFHLEMQIEDNLRAGMDPAEAHYAALRGFGAIEPMKEGYRERSAFTLVETTAQRGYLHYFFHALIGRSANDALSRIIAQRVHETKGGNALTTIDDYGFLLTVKPFQAMTEPEWKALFRRAGAEESLREALSESNLVKWQFRGVAQTGLMVPRRVHGEQRRAGRAVSRGGSAYLRAVGRAGHVADTPVASSGRHLRVNPQLELLPDHPVLYLKKEGGELDRGRAGRGGCALPGRVQR